MAIEVLKFGGTSVKDAECLTNVANIIAKRVAEKKQLVVVVSAQGKFTDILQEKADEITNFPNKREMDVLLSCGEQITTALLAMELQTRGIPAVSLSGWQAGIKTDANHTNARIKKIKTDRILNELDRGKVIIVAGFQGLSKLDEITTLGRGGSDTTAVALACALFADSCNIYTDVDGVYTCDPRVVKTAKMLDDISYDEVLEMASLGANVLHNRCVEIAKNYSMPIYVKSSFKDNRGTKITEVGSMEKLLISGVACDNNIACVSLFGIDKKASEFKIFSLLAKEGINVDVILKSFSEGDKNVAFTVSKTDLDKTQEIIATNLEALGATDVGYATDKSKVSLVGSGMAINAGVAAKTFELLSENSIKVDMISTSEIKISLIVDESKAEKAVKILHEEFLES